MTTRDPEILRQRSASVPMVEQVRIDLLQVVEEL